MDMNENVLPSFITDFFYLLTYFKRSRTDRTVEPVRQIPVEIDVPYINYCEYLCTEILVYLVFSQVRK